MPTLTQAAQGRFPMPFFELLLDAVEAARFELTQARAARPAVAANRRRRNLTLRPGLETPLWNELVRQVRPHLRQRGAKAQLARLLGVPRQRLHDCLRAQSACLDAERTLLLLGWLGFFQRGGALDPHVRPGKPRGPGKATVPGNL